MAMPDPLQLYRARGCSRQWLGFVSAMAEEFVAELPEAEAARLLGRIGRRFAVLHPLPAAITLDAVEVAANRVWADLEWGACRMREQQGHVDICHVAAPINLAVGDAAWVDGFLEGVYQGWFQQQGLLAGLAVCAVVADSLDVRRFRLARVA